MLNKKPTWYKNNKNDLVWWLDNGEDVVGVFIFSFNKKDTFNLFADYPHKLSAKQKEIFDKENPFWADYFSDRS